MGGRDWVVTVHDGPVAALGRLDGATEGETKLGALDAGDIVRLRRRIGHIRRALAPQRVAFAALGRPEMELNDTFGKPWPGLTERLDRTLDAVENLRELLLGTFDIQMGRAAKDANDVMKRLTLVSALFLPGLVLTGVMGMNFPLPFFDVADHFWIVVGAMTALALTILLMARWRGWL